jgi:hypothetical protein
MKAISFAAHLSHFYSAFVLDASPMQECPLTAKSAASQLWASLIVYCKGLESLITKETLEINSIQWETEAIIAAFYPFLPTKWPIISTRDSCRQSSKVSLCHKKYSGNTFPVKAFVDHYPTWQNETTNPIWRRKEGKTIFNRPHWSSPTTSTGEHWPNSQMIALARWAISKKNDCSLNIIRIILISIEWV